MFSSLVLEGWGKMHKLVLKLQSCIKLVCELYDARYWSSNFGQLQIGPPTIIMRQISPLTMIMLQFVLQLWSLSNCSYNYDDTTNLFSNLVIHRIGPPIMMMRQICPPTMMMQKTGTITIRKWQISPPNSMDAKIGPPTMLMPQFSPLTMRMWKIAPPTIWCNKLILQHSSCIELVLELWWYDKLIIQLWSCIELVLQLWFYAL